MRLQSNTGNIISGLLVAAVVAASLTTISAQVRAGRRGAVKGENARPRPGRVAPPSRLKTAMRPRAAAAPSPAARKATPQSVETAGS